MHSLAKAPRSNTTVCHNRNNPLATFYPLSLKKNLIWSGSDGWGFVCAILSEFKISNEMFRMCWSEPCWIYISVRWWFFLVSFKLHNIAYMYTSLVYEQPKLFFTDKFSLCLSCRIPLIGKENFFYINNFCCRSQGWANGWFGSRTASIRIRIRRSGPRERRPARAQRTRPQRQQQQRPLDSGKIRRILCRVRKNRWSPPPAMAAVEEDRRPVAACWKLKCSGTRGPPPPVHITQVQQNYNQGFGSGFIQSGSGYGSGSSNLAQSGYGSGSTKSLNPDPIRIRIPQQYFRRQIFSKI
jgi:hypothetical protein